MERAERDKRVLELLRRRDQVDAELEALHEKSKALIEEHHTIQADLATIMEVKSPQQPEPSGKQMTCSSCVSLGWHEHAKGHNKKGHDKYVKTHRPQLIADGKLKEAA